MDPTKTKLQLLADLPDFIKWMEQGRSATSRDGEGNTLTLVEMLAQAVEEDLLLRYQIHLTGPMVLMAKSAATNIRKADRTRAEPVKQPEADYGVPRPKTTDPSPS